MADGGCDGSILILLYSFILETWNKDGGNLQSLSLLTQRPDEMPLMPVFYT